jgi:hypothetical protein
VIPIDRIIVEELAASELDAQVQAESYRQTLSVALTYSWSLYQHNRRQAETIAQLRDELRRYTAAMVGA